jgi:hypothetical protein
LKRPTEFDLTERRSRVRYPIKLKVRFRTMGAATEAGTGETLDLSSRGMFVAAQIPSRFGVGSRVEITVEWPVLLDGATQLQLVAVGRVARLTQAGFAVSLGRHEFRTRKREPGSVPGLDRSQREAG